MKKFFQAIVSSLLAIITRFPFASIASIACSAILIYAIQTDFSSMLYTKLFLSLIVTLFLLVSLEYISLALGKKGWLSLRILGLIYGGVFFFYVEPGSKYLFFDSMAFLGLNLVGFGSSIFFAPFLVKNPYKVVYTNYFINVAWTAVMSAIVGGALAILGTIALGAIGELFEVRQIISAYRLHESWIAFSLAFIAVQYALAHLPSIKDLSVRYYDTNRFIEFLLKFVGIPFIIIYFCILYTYSAKVLASTEIWPKGIISWMVIAFSAFGYLVYIFSRSYEDGSAYIRICRRILPYAVFPQIGMLGYAIYLRINQYDLTVQRYLVVIFGVWLALISLYYIFSKAKSLIVIPASLTVIAFVMSIGPWSIYTLPVSRQYDLLVANLIEAKMYDGTTITKKTATLDPELENTISSQIQFVCEYSDCMSIKRLFAGQIKDPSSLTDVWGVLNEIRIALGMSNGPTIQEDNVLSYLLPSSYSENILFPLSVTGYDEVIRVYTLNTLPSDVSKNYVVVNPVKEELTIYGYGAPITLMLKEFNLGLTTKYPGKIHEDVKPEDLIFTGEINRVRVKVIFQRYRVAQNGNAEYMDIAGYALIKNI